MAGCLACARTIPTGLTLYSTRDLQVPGLPAVRGSTMQLNFGEWASSAMFEVTTACR
jgi:hypothetical protein